MNFPDFNYYIPGPEDPVEWHDEYANWLADKGDREQSYGNDL